MTQDNNWPCLEATLDQYGILFTPHAMEFLDAFVAFMEKVENASSKPPRAMQIQCFYAVITDLNNQLGEEAKDLEDTGNVETTTFEKLSIDDYFLHGGAPCRKTSDNYSLNDFNALDLLRNTPIGVPASTSVYRAIGELDFWCQATYLKQSS